jgi:aldehyde dehydrogenase
MSLSKFTFPNKFGNFINGKFVDPVDGKYFDNISPVTGQIINQSARSGKADIDAAVVAANDAFKTWKNVSVTERSSLLNKIADIAEKNKELLAYVEVQDNGKPIREATFADIPLFIDHFRYFASVIRADEGSHSELNVNTVSLIINEPIGVVGQIIPWNFPLLMAGMLP